MTKTVFPLKELCSFTGNIYEITAAAARRAVQMITIGDSAIEQYSTKATSLAARELFTGVTKYQIETK